MSDALKLGFAPFAAPTTGVLIVFCDDALKFGRATAKAIAPAADLIARAAKAEHFTGKSGSTLELSVPEGLKVARLVVIGAGKRPAAALQQKDLIKLGGLAMGKLPTSASEATVFADLPGGTMRAEQAADLAQGVRLRAYAFDRYKTKRKEDEKPPEKRNVTICGERCRRGAQGLRGARGGRRRRAAGTRSRQRAGQCALPGRIRPPRRRFEKSRRCGRGARPERRSRSSA